MVKKSRVLGVVALVLVCSILINTVGASGAGVNVRNIQLDISPEYEKYMNCYEEKSISYDEDEELVKFYGKAAYSESDSALFDNVSMEEYAEDEADVVYECSFDMEAMEFHFTASLLNEAREAIAVEEYYTDAIVTENGALDACIEIDGEEYMLSDYRAEEMLDNCFIGFFVRAIVAYVVVAECAERRKMKSNLTYNRSLEACGKGVKKGTYITDQSDVLYSGCKAGNYRLGFASFANVGCEVASAYNLMISIGRPEMLSDTIYAFEDYAIIISSGFGNLGSNPLEIGRYLDKRGVKYTKYISYYSFKKAVEKSSGCRVIMSRWNAKKTSGLHTFYVDKINKTKYRSYNWIGRYEYIDKSNIGLYNDGSGFIVGYVVSK